MLRWVFSWARTVIIDAKTFPQVVQGNFAGFLENERFVWADLETRNQVNILFRILCSSTFILNCKIFDSSRVLNQLGIFQPMNISKVFKVSMVVRVAVACNRNGWLNEETRRRARHLPQIEQGQKFGEVFCWRGLLGSRGTLGSALGRLTTEVFVTDEKLGWYFS